MQGLAENVGLRELNVSWNGFGDAETCDQLGAALESSNLTSVDLGYNRINRNEAIILSMYLERCDSIRKLVLDGNQISQSGARMILQASKDAVDPDDPDAVLAEISMTKCGIGIVDHSAFDPSEPAGEYELDLKDKFSQNVLLSLLRIVAQVCRHEPPPSSFSPSASLLPSVCLLHRKPVTFRCRGGVSSNLSKQKILSRAETMKTRMKRRP